MSIGKRLSPTGRGCSLVHILFVAVEDLSASRFSLIWRRHEAAPVTHQDQPFGLRPPKDLPSIEGPENH